MLKPITKKEGTPEEPTIAINTDSKELEVYENSSWELVDNSSSSYRMAQLKDLYTILYEKEWGIGGRLVVDEAGDVYLTTEKYESSVPVIPRIEDSFIKVSYGGDDKDEENFKKEYIKLINSPYMEQEVDLGRDYIRLMTSTRDLIGKSTIIDLFSYFESSADYRNILNLNTIPIEEKEGCTIRLEIMYTKSGLKKTGTLLFDPFKDNFLGTISDDIMVEVKNGCIRVFPEKMEVTECIIYHCYLIYESLS